MQVGSLCSGIGGIELGLASVASVEVAWHSEVDPAACRVLEERWPGVPNLGDLRAVDWTAVEPVDLLTAGYPCQPFSHAGKRGGADDSRHLWPAVADAVRVLRPRRVLLENVAGHLSLGFGRVLGDLAEAGFDAEWCCVRSSDVGAPHRRERVFIVAHADRGGRDEGRLTTVGRSVGSRRSDPRDPATAQDAGQDAAHAPELRRQRHGRARARGDGPANGDLGPYGPACYRWAARLGRATPAPTEGGKLSPAFVEWMLGYPDGWTLPAGSRNARLRCLGNSVQPQVAALAWQELT